MNNIILIGMPASGKSTVGVILAKTLGYDFVDTDILIQNREKARLDEIISDKGIEAFLKIECDVCCDLNVSSTVIATGGSVVYEEKAMNHLKLLGTIIYLKVDVDVLGARLSDMRRRGVALKEGQTLEDLFQERRALYEKFADVIIDENVMSLEETVAHVIIEGIGF